MAKKQTVDVMVEGGNATPAPPLGPALGPTGVNTAKVVADINKKTADFKGMKVPVKIIIEPSDKSYEIVVGSPPTAELLKKELGADKGAGDKKTPVGNLPLDKVVKVAKMKRDSLNAKDLKAAVKEVIGVAGAAGITVEGKNYKDAIKAVAAGEYDKQLTE
ncbi:50S ribosomal protein L11 [uncultured archaeon]|nr:50S ribosomal protein L11 [uncultured archaeon]